MLHACDQIFDVTRNLENFCELNKRQYVTIYGWSIKYKKNKN